jgi:hypothetical protein
MFYTSFSTKAAGRQTGVSEADERKGRYVVTPRLKPGCGVALTPMSHDVFLSYSRKDQRVAEAVRAALERRRLRVWIDKSISGGTDWAGAIVGALNTSRVMVLIFSRNANASPNVRREVERAVSKGLTLIPFRIENVEPSDAFELFLSLPQWIDAYAGPLERHLDKLCVEVRVALDASGGASSPSGFRPGEQRVSAVLWQPRPDEKKHGGPLPRKEIAIGVGAGVVLVALIGLFWFFRGPDSTLHDFDEQKRTSANAGFAETTPPVIPEIPSYQRICHETTEDCSNWNLAAPLKGALGFDKGLIKIDGVVIEIEGTGNVPAFRLARLVEALADTKTSVQCVRNPSGAYSCVTADTKENLADILTRPTQRRR